MLKPQTMSLNSTQMALKNKMWSHSESGGVGGGVGGETGEGRRVVDHEAEVMCAQKSANKRRDACAHFHDGMWCFCVLE